MTTQALVTRPVRVVLVDDTDDIRLLLRRALERAGGFDVVGEAGDGEAAVRAAGELQPDIVVLDLAMPIMDGLQALPLIRQCAPDTQVVVLSGFDTSAMAAEALEAGAATYLQKGAPLREMAATLRGIAGMQEPVVHDPASGPDFVAMVVHELKSPISTVAAFAELLDDAWDSFDDDRRREMAAAIGRQARPLVRLVDDLLVAARLEGGRLTIETRRVAVGPLVESALAAAGLEGVTVTGSATAAAEGDPERIQQVLVNLLTNAVRHGAPPVTVHIEDGSTVGIAVSDHGRGIAPADVPLLFDRFSPLARGKAGSNGLGLHLSRQLARAMGGDLVHAAAQPGSTFTLHLPAG